MGGDGGFVVLEDGGEIGEQHVGKGGGRRHAKGEGGTKMAGEGVDEGGIDVVLAEVWLIVSMEDAAESSDKAEA